MHFGVTFKGKNMLFINFEKAPLEIHIFAFKVKKDNEQFRSRVLRFKLPELWFHSVSHW